MIDTPKKHGRFSHWNRWNCENRIELRFQTGIKTASEPHKTTVLLGIRTAGTAGPIKLLEMLEPLELLKPLESVPQKPHRTAYIFKQLLTVLVWLYAVFAVPEPHKTARIAKTA